MSCYDVNQKQVSEQSVATVTKALNSMDPAAALHSLDERVSFFVQSTARSLRAKLTYVQMYSWAHAGATELMKLPPGKLLSADIKAIHDRWRSWYPQPAFYSTT